MSDNCLSKNPLLRDGTSQRQRLLKALLPSYVAVDERSMKDLFLFVQKLAAKINFHEYDASTDTLDISDWTDFFDIKDIDRDDFDFDAYLKKLKKKSETKPHLALLFGFLYLFK